MNATLERLLHAAGLLVVVSTSPGCAESPSSPGGASTGAGGSADLFVGGAGPSGDPGPFQAAPGASSGAAVTPSCLHDCTDLPPAPLFDDQAPRPVPPDAAARFGPEDDFDAAAGPCVSEPVLSAGAAPGALFPANWLRPRFRFLPAHGEDLFEIRLRVPSEQGMLVAYTTATTWALPRDVWARLGTNAVDQPITVTIRAVSTTSPGRPSGTRGTFTIAPVLAGGTMIYWAATSSDVTPAASKLVGFRVGDEGVVDALRIPDVKASGLLAEGGRDLRGQYGDAKGVPPGHVECIGCHASTPDGTSVGFTDHWPWNTVITQVGATTVGTTPSWVSPGAARLLDQPWLGMLTFSKAHFSPGDRIAVTSYSNRSAGTAKVGFSDSHDQSGDRLAWFDLETSVSIPWQSGQPDPMNAAIQAAVGTAWGFLVLDGESRAALTPSFSHDGTKIAYTSTTSSQDGRIGDGAETDVAVVPFADRKGGTAERLQGASTPGVSEYYPSFSADDALIAFNRAASTSGKIYYRPDAEVYVVPASGGVATRLVANDPPACTGEHSPGIINSWAKWSPSVAAAGGKHYYFLIFSSARSYPGSFRLPANQYSPSDTRASQLYVTAIVRDDATAALTTYPAIYLWNQEPSATNLTPSWDEVDIPPVPPPLR
jgi:hypothetical protein